MRHRKRSYRKNSPPSEFRICRVCGQSVKIYNLESHFKKVHQEEINELKPIKAQVGECLICGANIEKQQYGFVCDKHKIQILPKFLVGDILLPLRKQVNSVLEKAGNRCIDYFLQMYLAEMYVSLAKISKRNKKEETLSFATDEITHDQLVTLSDKTVFLGYTLSRLSEALPLIGERAYQIARRSESRSHAKTRYDSNFLEMLYSEFEFFYAAYFGLHGLFDVALDSEKDPKQIFIIPNANETSVLKMIMLRIKDVEFVYRASFYPIIHPSSEECVFDRRGSFFCYPRKSIEDNYEVFRKLWSEHFGSKLPINYDQYMAFRWYFKWIVCPIGFTIKNKWKARYLKEFKDFDEETLFSLIDMILPDVCSTYTYVSSSELGSADSTYRVLAWIFNLGLGFRFSSSKGMSYFLPVIEWLNNLLTPVHMRFGRTLGLAGSFYEEWIGHMLKAFSEGRLGFKFTEEFGYVPILKSNGNTSSVLPWRLLEKNKEIRIKCNGDENTSCMTEGEIDLIVYANYSLYLLELKSINLDDKKALKYLNTKAPKQCRKYSDWAKADGNIDCLLKRHGIEKKKLRSVRVMCCTNGVYDKTTIVDAKTGEAFAVIPAFLLLNLFAGVFTMSVRNVIPSFVSRMKNGLTLALPSLKEAYYVENGEMLSKVANGLIRGWHSLMMFDRRRSFSDYKAPKAQPFNLAKFYISREVFIGDECSWLLTKPKLIGHTGGFRYYVGTQISDAGTTLVCRNCKSLVKYYFSTEENEQDQVTTILEQKKCCFCGKKTSPFSENIKEGKLMSFFVGELKKELDRAILNS